MKLKCIIVDDEEAAHGVLRNYIERLNYLELVGEAYNAIEAGDILLNQTVDIMFLDINMPEISGLEFISTLNNPPKVILTTAYSEFALDAFDLGVVDYLLKPVPFVRFLKSINKINAVPLNDEKLPVFTEQKIEDKLSFKIAGVIRHFMLDEILYFQSYGNYIKIYTPTKTHLTILTMRALEEYLDKSIFIRVHKSYIIPISFLRKNKFNEKIYIGQTEIPVGRTYKVLIGKLGEV
jgi:DNA-binding LytR/AlgR family response regulator